MKSMHLYDAATSELCIPYKGVIFGSRKNTLVRRILGSLTVSATYFLKTTRKRSSFTFKISKSRNKET